MDIGSWVPIHGDWSYTLANCALHFIKVKYLSWKTVISNIIFRMWNKVFHSSIIRGLETQLIYYFYVLIAVLILFFLDAIREMQKYSSEEQITRRVGLSHLDTQMQMQMRLFRAQRNFFIAGLVNLKRVIPDCIITTSYPKHF